MGRLAGTGVKLKGKLTLEFDKDVDLESLLPLLTSQPNSPPIPAPTNLESLLPLFPQPYLSSPSSTGQRQNRKFNYQSPDRYPVSGGLINKGEGVSQY